MWWAGTAGGGLAVAVIGAASLASASPLQTCAPEAGDRHHVVRVIDGETVELDNGREVRLMGAMAPRPNALTVDVATWPPAREAARALETLVLNRAVALRYEGRRRDRYGRALAQLVLAEENGDAQAGWVQHRLVAAGYARAYALPGNTGCLRSLMATEQEARAARRGLWSGEHFRVHAATEVAALLRLVGRFVVVEGRVAGVTRTRRYTYVNFGADWRDDFTVSLRTSAVDRAEDGETRAQALEGRTVRARGWIERRNGPAIELSGLDEIEVLDEAPATAAAAAGACSLPPCGEGLGVGGSPTADGLQFPPPNLPHKGRGTGR